MVGEGVKSDRHGNVGRRANEYQVEYEGNAQEIFEWLASNIQCTVDKVCDHRVASVELDKYIPTVCGECSKAQNCNDARYQAQYFKSGWETQDANAH